MHVDAGRRELLHNLAESAHSAAAGHKGKRRRMLHQHVACVFRSRDMEQYVHIELTYTNQICSPRALFYCSACAQPRSRFVIKGAPPRIFCVRLASPVNYAPVYKSPGFANGHRPVLWAARSKVVEQRNMRHFHRCPVTFAYGNKQTTSCSPNI